MIDRMKMVTLLSMAQLVGLNSLNGFKSLILAVFA
jgi:hypothetical protein